MSTILTLAATAVLVACAPAGGGSAPADLLITYSWSEGSLPPPYHYAYTIRLQADGTGAVTMVPDYPGADVPVWSEPFTLGRAELDALFATMVEQGLLTQRWRGVDDPPVGGSFEHMSVVAAGRAVELPAFLPPAQQGRAQAIYGALRAAVPQAIFADLEARRAAYVAEHE